MSALSVHGPGLQPLVGGVYDPEAMTLCKLLFALTSAVAYAQNPSPKEVESVYPDAHALYVDLHQHPELSGHETETAVQAGDPARNAGYEVTEHVGGTGVVAC